MDIFAHVELNLNNLEKRIDDTIEHISTDKCSFEEDYQESIDILDRVKVVVLGAPGVGKSSIIRVRVHTSPTFYDCDS